MAGVITHIFIANRLLKNKIISVQNETEFYLGVVAPDAVMSNKNYTRDDKLVSHLRDNIPSDRWYQDQYQDIFKTNLRKFYDKEVYVSQSDYSLGYLVHLITDQVFHYSFRDDIEFALKSKNIDYDNNMLKEAMLNDLDIIDYYLLEKNDYIKEVLNNTSDKCNIFGNEEYVTKESVCKNFVWIESKYFGVIPDIEPVCFTNKKVIALLSSLYNGVVISLNNVIDNSILT
jgi:hypothetical protein